MRVTFFGNFLNHHQIPFCNEMAKHLDDRFTFIATSKITDERLQLGYKDYSDTFGYSINAYESEKQNQKALALARESDVVIFGSAPERFLTPRLATDRLTFRYSERLFKRGTYRLMDPRVLAMSLEKHTRHRKKNLHLLCASAYAARDASLLFAYPDKMWKWGYFPQVYEYSLDERFKHSPEDTVKILWTGRFIDWKHPEYAIRLAKVLKIKNYDFSLIMIGDGMLKSKVEKLAHRIGLQDKIRFMGAMSTEDVRRHMMSSDIFLVTSDKQEGWGAVVNESMNSSCAVIVSDAVGAAHFMVKHNYNGLLFKSGDLSDLISKAEYLLINKNEIRRLGQNAYNTMISEWNAGVADQRLLKLTESILERKEAPFLHGPCSKAD